MKLQNLMSSCLGVVDIVRLYTSIHVFTYFIFSVEDKSR